MHNLLFLIACVLAIFVSNTKALNEEQEAKLRQKFLEFGAACIKDIPLSLDDINSFKSKKLPESDGAGCFIACVFKAAGLIDDKGLLTNTTALENAKKIFEDDGVLMNVEKFINTCIKVNDEKVSDEEKGCDRAQLAFICLSENSEKFGFNIDF